MTTNYAGGMYNDETQKHLREPYPPYAPAPVHGLAGGPDYSHLDDKRQSLLSLHEELCRQGRELMELKNQDYGGVADPFANFRRFGALGILVRLDDKLSRLTSFVEKGDLKLKSESVQDTIVDGINYLVLLAAFLKSEGMIDGFSRQ